MDLKLANCCGNCEHLLKGQICSVREIGVSENQVCNSFEFRAMAQPDDDCLKCSKFQTTKCAHPQEASEGILCTVWYPRVNTVA